MVEVGVPVHPRDFDPVHRPRRAAVAALDLEEAAEADEIAGGGDVFVGHGRAVARGERFVNIAQGSQAIHWVWDSPFGKV